MADTDKRCTASGDHHSSDLVAVYHGLADPSVMCGYCAGRRFPSTAGRVWRNVTQPTPKPVDKP